jgi:glycosyltransferase involved in cell wall biosynthesis
VQITPREAELKWAFRKPPDLVITCARFFREGVAAAIPDCRRPRVQIEVVPNAVDLARFRAADRRQAKSGLGCAPDVPVALMLANLSPHKGQATAIRAVAELARRGTRVECWLAGVERAGSQGYREKLQALADGLGVGDRVRLFGFRDDAQVLLAAADVVLLPSTDEGLPLTLLEAQACERAVVAAPTAGIPEIIDDGLTGFLVAADDHAGYAGRIELLLRDVNLYAQMTQRARRLVEENNSWEVPTGVGVISGLEALHGIKKDQRQLAFEPDPQQTAIHAVIDYGRVSARQAR